ncbi:MAG TPA: hypothetical protein PKX07_00365 [Aggregatilineales bacterium]|nr:hypothetical protein [Aggregatilineales bacterium]
MAAQDIRIIRFLRSRVIQILVLTLAVLTGCGVRVEISTPPAPTPTPRYLPPIDYSRGGVWREQASPQIAFISADNARYQLFVEPDPPDITTLTDRPLWLAAGVTAMWFDSPQSTAQIRLSVYIRQSETDSWTLVESVQETLTTDVMPARRETDISVMLYPEQPGIFQVRTEVSAIVSPASAESQSTVESNQMTVFVVRDPGEIEIDSGALWPGYGEIDPSQPLWDWRGWFGGPCSVAEWSGDHPDVVAACNALESGDAEAAEEHLIAAAPVMEDLLLRAGLLNQAALIAAVSGDIENADARFTEALNAFILSENAVLTGAALHNLAASAFVREDAASTDTLLSILNELRALFYDEAGNVLTQSLAGRVYDEPWRVTEARDWLKAYDLPQADALARWLGD